MISKFGDYRCPSEVEEMNWAITACYSGVFFGMVLLIILGDCFGRKGLSSVNLLVASLGIILTAFSGGLLWATIGLFLANLGLMASFNINFYFIT
jgi:MFS family permease